MVYRTRLGLKKRLICVTVMCVCVRMRVRVCGVSVGVRACVRGCVRVGGMYYERVASLIELY